MYNRWLRAYASYEDRSLEWGSWLLSGGANEGLKERFEVAATRAGMALRLGVTGKPFEVWLHHVFLDLLEHQSKLLFAGTSDGGIIVRVCEASAVYCSRLEKNTLQAENDGKKAHEPTSIESTVPSRPIPSRSRPGRISARSADFVNLAGKLWLDAKRESGNASVTGKQLNQIASSLDDQKYVPPAKYLEDSCARELKSFNSKNSNSRVGPIQTWSQLVAIGDKDHLRGMRRLLSRCAEKHAL